MVPVDRAAPSFVKENRKLPKAYEGIGQYSQISRDRWTLGSKFTSIQLIRFNIILTNKRYFCSIMYAKEREDAKERLKIEGESICKESKKRKG